MLIRMFDENQDVDNFLELFQISFGKPISKDHLAWKYTNNPFRLNMYPIIVAEENERLIGARCVVPCKMLIKDTVIYATRGTDIMVHPEFRGRGINLELLKVGHELYRESQYVINYVFPNDMSIRNIVRAGHKPIHQHTSHWKILNLKEVLDKAFNNTILQKIGVLFYPLI